jgi:glycosyltransferase involved in cell wall biosynthesis
MIPHLKVSVIIPSYKRPSDLKRCLVAVALQTRPADEILVVTRDGDAEALQVMFATHQELNGLRVVYVAEPGLIAALNCGLDNATGDILVFTDDDAEAQADWLERIEASFTDAAIGAVGGRDWLQLPLEPALFRPPQVAQVGVLSWYGTLYGNHHCPVRGHRKRVMFLKGVNMAFRRTTLGSFRIDTSLRGSGAQVGTELDLCMHVRRSGFAVIFEDRIVVKHHCAARPTGDDRNDMAGPVRLDISYNVHYLIAKHFSLCWSLVHLCNSLLLGSRFRPGLLASLKWAFKGDGFVLRRLLDTIPMALSGFHTGRHARKAARPNSADLHTAPSAG